MGTIYYIACRECRVKRDLDKFYSARPVANRAEALELCDKTENFFRHVLLSSFCATHRGHELVFFTDSLKYKEDDFPEDADFWHDEAATPTP